MSHCDLHRCPSSCWLGTHRNLLLLCRHWISSWPEIAFKCQLISTQGLHYWGLHKDFREFLSFTGTKVIFTLHWSRWPFTWTQFGPVWPSWQRHSTRIWKEDLKNYVKVDKKLMIKKLMSNLIAVLVRSTLCIIFAFAEESLGRKIFIWFVILFIFFGC